ncbi:MAG: CoA transferase subunit A [Tissierellia bacterium]|nr:CoA transferase subunit A [Tissierellia bacterium]MDD3226004.1 CoA transferase subunit A [Tissierellia bacterium]MDD3750497.1 CoA transferase subunit A [Tissierellia bacterium]MDD4045966.1 CoA transferase subunit A [Tissierellia bacterium]MDD4677838.1 CoA transferase subunit A [Tissierellia bacterium]
MNKIISITEAADMVKDGMTVMVGGFLANGTPETIIDALVEKNVKNLTLICNDTGFPDKGVGKMVVNKQFKKIIASHVGTNPETANQMNSGETEVVLTPQGTLAEKVRCGGNGLGGFYTPTGVGTEAAEGKEHKVIDGKEYIFETPLKADVALLRASTADKKGNLIFKKTMKNFNPIMATAADLVIVEADKIVEVGEIDPEHVMCSGIFVDYIVGGDK